MILLVDYLMLGLEPGATDDEIRRQYLALVKTHPPEHDPQRFQDITQAYERIKDQRSRIRHRLFSARESADVEASLAYLVRAFTPKRRRAGLQELIKAVSKV
jgi:curved DNA-binding protein CbpA